MRTQPRALPETVKQPPRHCRYQCPCRLQRVNQGPMNRIRSPSRIPSADPSRRRAPYGQIRDKQSTRRPPRPELRQSGVLWNVNGELRMHRLLFFSAVLYPYRYLIQSFDVPPGQDFLRWACRSSSRILCKTARRDLKPCRSYGKTLGLLLPFSAVLPSEPPFRSCRRNRRRPAVLNRSNDRIWPCFSSLC